MEILKLTSIRLPKSDIQKADSIGRSFSFYSRSTVLRVAVWIGLKILSERNFSSIVRLMDVEEVRRRMPSAGQISLEDVLRAAGVYPE